MNGEAEVYRLYALPQCSISYAAIESEEMTRITPEKILLFSATQPACEHKEVSDEEASAMTLPERLWLMSCKTCVINRWASENEEAIAQTMMNFMDAFETELEAEKQKTVESSTVDEKPQGREPAWKKLFKRR